MSGNTGTIKIALKMDDKGTIKVLKTTGSTSEKTGKKGKKAFDDMDKSSRSFTRSAGSASTAMMKMAGGLATVLGVAAAWNKLKSVTREYVSLANTQEEAETDLGAVLRSTGQAAGYNMVQLKTMASAMQDVTRTGDEVILSGMAILATFKQVRGEAFERASMAALDMSRIMKQDLKSSMVMVGKALNDPAIGLTALGRAGVTFSDDQKTVIKALQETGDMASAQAIILDELESQFGGTASMAATLFAGRVEQAKNALGDAKEEMGYVITKNQVFIEVARMATDEFKRWGKQTALNRKYLQSLAKDGLIKVVDGIGLGLETLRFFHNGWQGIKLVGNAAVHALAVAMDELNPIMRKLMLPLDALFNGLVKLGVIDTNPFDALAQGLSTFRESSGEVTRQVLADIDSTNQKYDAVAATIQGMREKIVQIPAAHIEANDQIKSSTAATYDELNALAAKYADTATQDKRKKANQRFLTDFKRATLSAFDFERDQLKVQYAEYDKYVTDKQALNLWYSTELARITDEESAAVQKANKSTMDSLSDAFAGWATSYSSSLNNMLWESEWSFGEILKSFGKMLTQMAIQKSMSGLFDWGGTAMKGVGGWISGLFNAHGNAFGRSGQIPAYAHGAPFTNKIVEKPTLFAHGGGLGIMGEKTPEVIAPLFRASNGDMGVKARVESAAPPITVRLEVINNTGVETDVKKQEPRFDGTAWVCGVVLNKITGSRAYKQNMNTALGRV